MNIAKNKIIPKELLDKYNSVYFANEEHTICVVSKRFRNELRYNYIRVSDESLLLDEWCVSAGDFINKTAIVLTKDGNHKVITEDGEVIITRAYYTSLSHYYYGTFVGKQSYDKGAMYELLNLNGLNGYFTNLNSIQKVDKSKLVGRQPKYFWLMSRGKYNFINSKGMLLLKEACDGFEDCDNKEYLHAWYDVSKKYQNHKYVRISDGEVVTEGDFKKVTKISHGLWQVENTSGYCNILGYNQEFIFSSWHKSINVITLDEKYRVCFLVSDDKEDKIRRYLYSSSGKKITEIDDIISLTNKSWLKVEYEGNRFYVDAITGEIISSK